MTRRAFGQTVAAVPAAALVAFRAPLLRAGDLVQLHAADLGTDFIRVTIPTRQLVARVRVTREAMLAAKDHPGAFRAAMRAEWGEVERQVAAELAR